VAEVPEEEDLAEEVSVVEALEEEDSEEAPEVVTEEAAVIMIKLPYIQFEEKLNGLVQRAITGAYFM
jgi:hypothetical protein